MAIWLLFHPYQAKFIPGTRLQLPLTPGILPRGRANLTQSIADTVTTTLLTEADLQQQAEKLLTEENLTCCLDAIVDSIEREMQNKEQVRHLYRYGAEVVPEMLAQLANGLIDRLEGGSTKKINGFIEQLLAQGLGSCHLTYPHAELMTDMLFSTLLTPEAIRHMLVEGLTDRNIQRIETQVSSRVGGLKGILVRFMGLSQTLSHLRDFCAQHPQEAEAQITEVLDRMEVQERLAERISNFSFSKLPEENREAITAYLGSLLRETLVDQRGDITGLISEWSGAASRLLINQLLQINIKVWLNEKHPALKSEIIHFVARYLNRERNILLARALPALNIGQMIVEKLDQFSNAELEHMIYGICRRELRWLAILGAFLGFWLGLISNLINFWLQSG